MTRLHARHANVVGLACCTGTPLAAAAGHFNDAIGELDREVSEVGEHLDERVLLAGAAIRAGTLLYRQQRRRDRCGGRSGSSPATRRRTGGSLEVAHLEQLGARALACEAVAGSASC